jgi:aspartyl-tRNA(Asn)/glutamyl-tRNA(Gln) amidotransferase subunit A
MTVVKDEYSKLLNRFDILLSPAAPGTAQVIGEGGDQMNAYMRNIYGLPASLAGLPAAALPCGFSKQGLPIGLQLIAGAFAEEKLVRAGRVFQSLTDYHTRKPASRSHGDAAFRGKEGTQ